MVGGSRLPYVCVCVNACVNMHDNLRNVYGRPTDLKLVNKLDTSVSHVLNVDGFDHQM